MTKNNRLAKNFWKELEFRMTMILLLVIALLSTTIYYVTYKQFYTLTINKLKSDAANVHKYAEEVIDERSFYEINTREDEESEIYKTVHNQLDEIRRIANIRYLYTAKKDNDEKLVYVMDGLNKDDSLFRHVGDPIESEIIPQITQCLNNEIVLRDEILHTEWGTVYVAYFPFHNAKGEVIGTIGMEFDCEYLMSGLKHARSIAILVSILLGIIFIAISSLVIRKVVRNTSAVFTGLENSLREANERTMLMLDTSPLCTQIWDRNLNTIDCNEAGVKLYGFKDKQEYTERFIAECSPEYQPDGQRSDEKAVALVNKAFEEGYCIFDWTHRIPYDDSLMPAEVTLVRAKYKNEDVVLGYTRDIREHEKMMQGIMYRDNLLQAVNQVATLLLTTDESEDVEVSLTASMELVGRSINADRVQIWRCEADEERGDLLFSLTYTWHSETGKEKKSLPVVDCKFPLRWENKFSRKKHVCGPLSKMPMNEQVFLNLYQIKSTVAIPLFLDEKIWGLFSIDDCVHERDFKEDQIAILRSVSLMMVSTINRQSLVAKRTRELALQTTTLTTLFDSIPNLIFTRDSDLNFMHCNKAFLEHFGRTMEDLAGKNNMSDLGLPPQIAKILNTKDCEVIIQNRTITIEEHIPRVDGTNPFYETTKIPLLMGGEAIGVMTIAHDITERKKTERTIASRYEYAKKLNDALAKITKLPTISAGILKDAADAIVKEGCRALNVNGVGIWNLAGDKEALKNISYYDASSEKHSIQNDYDLSKRQEYFKLLKTERVIAMNSTEECKMITDSDSDKYNNNLCAALDAPIRIDGKLVGVVCVEQKHCEEFKEKREWAVEEQNFASSLADFMALAISGAERRQAREAAELASQTKSVFLANMSHEIRTPMNAIIGITEILIQNEALPDDVENGLHRIYTSCDLLLGIINDILDLSKIEAGKLGIMSVRYRVASMINDSIQLNMMRMESKPIKFEVKIDENIPANLLGDELRIKQILNNLLSNAFKYTSAGSVTLTAESISGSDENSTTLVLGVHDTGHGMTKEQLNKMFEEYSRFNDGKNSNVEGTGLGLSITRRLIDLMNGEIEVESQPGKGTSITVRLPQGVMDNEVLGAEAAENLRQPHANHMTYRRKSHQVMRDPMPYGRVLIVDDVDANLYVGVGLMKLYRLQIDTAVSGYEAVDKIKAGKEYDIIFMDHMMPGMDGIMTTKYLRTMGYGNPIVALTANAVSGVEDIFMRNGFDGFISKPIDIRQLNSILNKFVRDKQPPEVIEQARQQKECSEKLAQHTEDAAAAPETVSRFRNREVAGMDIAKGLKQYDGDEDIYLKVLRSYVDAIRSMLANLVVVDEGNLADYERAAHSIKGASYGVFAERIAGDAAMLEKAAKENDLDYIKKHNQALLEAAQMFIADLDNMITTINAENPKPKKEKPDAELLAGLKSACTSYNMYEVDAVMDEIEKYQYTADDGLADWLRECVDKMAFGQIIKKLSD